MWPFKSKPIEEKPQEETFEEKCAFMDQIVLDHASGGNVIITIQGKDVKHVEYVSKKIKDTFSAPKIKPSLDSPFEKFEKEMSQLNGLSEIWNAFKNGKI